MSKRIDQLTAATNAQAVDDTYLWIIGDPATGTMYKVTRAQLISAFGLTQKYDYVATGAEGTTLTIGDLASKDILLIIREGNPLHETNSAPDTVEYTWDNTDIVLGLATKEGDRFTIIYNA